MLVLVGEALADNNSYVSPLVSSFTKQYEPQDILLTAREGTVIPPTAAETAAAAAGGDPDTAWLGCIVAANAAMAGTLVEVSSMTMSLSLSLGHKGPRAPGCSNCELPAGWMAASWPP